jgi:hypothetical protein
MHKYKIGATFESIAIDIAESVPASNRGKGYLMIAMDYFTMLPEDYDIPNQEASSLADTPVTNCRRFCIWMELHSDQGRHVDSRLLQRVMEHLGFSKTRTIPLHL